MGSLVVALRILSCGMRTLSCSMHMGSSSLTRDRTWAPSTGSAESYPLRHQGSPNYIIVFKILKLISRYHSPTFSWAFPTLRNFSSIMAYFGPNFLCSSPVSTRQPPTHYSSNFFFKHLYWSIIALQWCVSFCFITK